MKLTTRAFCFAALFLAGCATTGGPDIPRIAAAVQLAAQVGTSEAIRDHNEWRPAFQLVRNQLNTLAAQESLTLDSLLTVISGLPVNELSSDTARLSFEAARIVLIAAGWSEIEIVRTDQLRPVIVALSAGITAGLGQEPAMTVRPSAKHYRAK